MNKVRTDITQTIISSQDINHRIGAIFPDSAVLDLQFNIISISHNILGATGYSSNDLKGKPVEILTESRDFKRTLEGWLLPGYFEEQSVNVRCKDSQILSYSISGFYMGLIADLNGLIILKFKNQDEVTEANRELAAKSLELDDFVYASSHSLRGPLATLKGLINIATLTTEPEEVTFLLKQMGLFADKLDEKLHHLIYVAESDKSPDSESGAKTIQSIFETLSASIQEASIDFPVDFCCPVVDQQHTIEKANEILSMLNNVVRFFCQQPKNEGNLLVLDIHSSSSATEIMICSKGFMFSSELIDKIANVNFGYSEILNFPELLNYYATKKIMNKLNGNVQFMLLNEKEVVVLMTVPRESQQFGL